MESSMIMAQLQINFFPLVFYLVELSVQEITYFRINVL
jgi:hypothetical protein